MMAPVPNDAPDFFFFFEPPPACLHMGVDSKTYCALTSGHAASSSESGTRAPGAIVATSRSHRCSRPARAASSGKNASAKSWRTPSGETTRRSNQSYDPRGPWLSKSRPFLTAGSSWTDTKGSAVASQAPMKSTTSASAKASSTCASERYEKPQGPVRSGVMSGMIILPPAASIISSTHVPVDGTFQPPEMSATGPLPAPHA
mmetsp:Transcript_4190/g.13130  ORF Transcript_4190/g.13130 Transcript_4190/m.13130 type:complete len:202 (-) Transcript_4190:856-1461(-)